jgi:hypothetical protein
MHFFNKIKTKNERLEGSYLLVLRQYLCHKKYITTLLLSSFVVVAFLLATFCMWLPSYFNYRLMINLQQQCFFHTHTSSFYPNIATIISSQLDYHNQTAVKTPFLFITFFNFSLNHATYVIYTRQRAMARQKNKAFYLNIPWN